jgi:hypothetical protein
VRKGILSRFLFALCLSYHFQTRFANFNPCTRLPSANYSFKVVFRVFRDFHSVPVKLEICSSWNTLCIHLQIDDVFRPEHIAKYITFRPTRSPRPPLLRLSR